MCIIICSVGSVRAREHIHHVGIHHVRLRISIFGVDITRLRHLHLDLKQTSATSVLLFGGVGPALLVEMSLALLQCPLELSSEKPLMAMRLQAIATG